MINFSYICFFEVNRVMIKLHISMDLNMFQAPLVGAAFFYVDLIIFVISLFTNF